MVDVTRVDYPLEALRRWAERHFLSEVTDILVYLEAQKQLHGKVASLPDGLHKDSLVRALEGITRPETPRLSLLFSELLEK